MPWVSTPRRSARTSALAMIVAFVGGTELAIRRDSMNVCAVVGRMWIFVFEREGEGRGREEGSCDVVGVAVVKVG